MAGCAAVPVEQLRAYSDAYDEAREAGSQLYQRASLAVKVAEVTAVEPAAAPPYLGTLGPATYSTGACGAGGEPMPESVIARCDAFTAVATYNEILLKLAAGDPAVAVRSDLGRIAVALQGLQSFLEQNPTAQTLLAGAAPVVGPLLGIVGQAQQLANAAAVREELEAGRPAVLAILEALREDVPRLYAMQRELAVGQLRESEFAIADIYLEASGIVERHHVPGTQPHTGERTAIVGRFDALLDELELPDMPKDNRLATGATGAAPYTAATTASLRGQLDRLEQAAAHHRDITRRWQGYVAALRLYDGMLLQLGESLASLGTTDVTNLFAPDGAAAQWLASAITIRDQAREIKANL